MSTPKFLTKEVAQAAVVSVVGMIFDQEHPAPMVDPKRKQCHIVVLVPAQLGAHVEAKATIPMILFERSLDEHSWPWDFRGIARSKAFQLWRGQNDGRTDIMPHLLFEGDSPYWGGVMRQGIVVACSGIEPWFDRMISGMIADMCIGIARDQWEKSKDKAEDVCFLTQG